MGRDFVMSSGAEYQDRFAREQSLQMQSAEWECRLPPMQTYWDRAWAGLFGGLIIGGLAFLIVVGV